MSEERHHDLQSKLPNADMQGALAALLRIVIVRDGVLVEEKVEKARRLALRCY